MRLVTATVSVTVLAAALVVAPIVSVGATAKPVRPTVVNITVPDAAPARASGAKALPGARLLAAALTHRDFNFDVAGVTFDGGAPAGLVVEARAHTASGWSPWEELDLDVDGPDASSTEGRRARHGTAPLMAAGSDGIDVRVSSPSGAAPSGLSATLVDGGTSPADAALGSTAGSASASVGGPSIVTRAGWGADESLRPCTPDTLAGFKAAVVHHTVDSNGYSASQAAALMRGIYAYHTQSLEWCDIGYNFLVDRFGRLYEGRKGGLDSFIQGAQAGGFNVDTFGVSVIGDFTSTGFPPAVTSALSRVIAWQADRSGFDPATSVTLTSAGSTRYSPGVRVSKPRVMGHRDLSLTECPGNTSDPQLPSVRASAAAQWKAGHYVQPAARFAAVGPRRVLDTRLGTGAPKGALGSNRSLVLTVPGLPSNTTAVTLNVTAMGATASTFVSAYPTGESRPNVSLLNLTPGRTVAGQVSVGVSPGNSIRLYNGAGNIQLIADLEGYFTTTAASGFTATTPRRVLDTRVGTGAPKGKIKAGSTLTYAVPGLPPTATAVSLNLTATGTTGSTYLTAYPAGRARPTASVLNPGLGETVANRVTIPVGAGGTVSVHTGSADVDLIADLSGYYATGSGSRFVALSPRRVLDTRYGFNAPGAKVAGGSTLGLAVAGVPSTATGVALTLTATGITGSGAVLAYPTGIARPNASTLNAVAGRTVANFATVGVAGAGSINLHNGAPSLHLVGDLTGYFAP